MLPPHGPWPTELVSTSLSGGDAYRSDHRFQVPGNLIVENPLPISCGAAGTRQVLDDMDVGPAQGLPPVGVAQGPRSRAKVGETLLIHYDLFDGDLQKVPSLSTLDVYGPPNGIPLGRVELPRGQVVEPGGDVR